MARHTSALVAALCASVIFIPAALTQEKKPPEQAAPEAKSKTPAESSAKGKIPEEDVKRANPVKPDADSLAQGKRIFNSQCAMCHGEAGDGKGDLATDMKLNMKNYTDVEALKDFTDGELFYILTNGKDKMPGQGDRMPDTQKWNLINYIRSFSKKATPEKKEPAPAL